MLQHVKEPTHVRGHTLDAVITKETNKIVSCLDLTHLDFFDKVSKGAKIRNRYNQVPHLTQDTNGKVTNSQ